MPKKRMGRPAVIEPGESQNVYLPARHRQQIKALARQNYVSFSAVVRMAIEEYLNTHGVTVEELR